MRRRRAASVVVLALMTALLTARSLPEGVTESDALVATVVVDDDPDGSVYVLGAGTRVPDVVGGGLADAQATVEDAGLVPLLDPEPDDAAPFDTDGLLVTEQTPDADDLVRYGTAVQLQPGVRVPDLAGMSLAEAEAAAEDGRVRLAADGPSDGTVGSQVPEAETLVALGSAVAVVLDPVPVEDLVTVPNLDGLTPDEARARLAEDDLVLSPTVDGDPDVATADGQDPPAGPQVRPESTVQATFSAPVVGGGSDGEEPQDPATRPTVLLLVAALLLLGLLVAAISTRLRALRRRRERRWLREHVRCSPSHGHVVPPQLHESDPAAGLSVRAEGRRDAGRQLLEEVRP